MSHFRLSQTLSVLFLAGVTMQACGKLPEQAQPTVTSRNANVVRVMGGERWMVLDNFDTEDRRYEYFGPVQHPFFSPVSFTTVRSTMTGTAVQEILGTAGNKPHKGVMVCDLAEDGVPFERGPEGKRQLAKQVFVTFKWGVNGASGSDPSTFVSVIFAARSRTGTRAVGYAWSDRLCPGTILNGTLPLYDGPVPLRTIVLNKGTGLGQPCGESALQRIRPETVERNLAADFRWAYDSTTPVAGDGEGFGSPVSPCPSPPARSTPNWPCPVEYVQGTAGEPMVNTELLGLSAFGFGAEIARGVCAHSILDDLAYQLHWKE